MNINHKMKEISFDFRSDDGEIIDSGISSLSGGEKSFIQVRKGNLGNFYKGEGRGNC
jgi:hypothetical protein